MFSRLKARCWPCGETAAGEQDGKIRGVVDVRVAEIAAVEDHGVVQQSPAVLGLSGEITDKLSQLHEMFAVRGVELAQLFLVPAVMAELMVGVGCLLLIGQADYRSAEGVHDEGNDAGRVALEGKLRHVEHEPKLIEEALALADVPRRRLVRLGLRSLLPLAGGLKALFHLAHRGEVLIEPLLVGGAQRAVETSGFPVERVENAATSAKTIELPLHVGGIALNEPSSETRPPGWFRVEAGLRRV